MRLHRRGTLFGLGLAGLLIAGCQLLDDRPAEPPLAPIEFAQFDTNGDGALDPEEAAASGRQRLLDAWDDMDVDGDQRVSRSEFEVWLGVENL